MHKNAKILITGGNGLLGQAITRIFKQETDFEYYVTSVESESFSTKEVLYLQLDITSKEKVKEIISYFKPDLVINCAAFTDVDKCETEREACWRLNVDAVKNLIIALRPHNKKLVHFSTDYIFDGKNGPYDERATPNPISFYGRSKLAAENAIVTSGIEHVIIRTMVLFGVAQKVKPNFAIWLTKKLEAKERITIVNDQIGNSTLVDDLAYGTLKLIEADKKGIYNVAGLEIESRLEFAYKVCEVFGYDKNLISVIKTKDLNQPAPRPLNSGLITLKTQSEVGFKAMNTIESLQVLKYHLGI